MKKWICTATFKGKDGLGTCGDTCQWYHPTGCPAAKGSPKWDGKENCYDQRQTYREQALKNMGGGTMKTYPIVCPSCRGTGYIDDPRPVTSTAQIICPACQGTKVVIVTEA